MKVIQQYKVLNFNFYILLATISLLASQAHASGTCATTEVVSGSTCSDLMVKFDFSKCDPKTEAQTMQSKCVNNKAVAFAVAEGKGYTATYIKKDGVTTNGGFSFATIRDAAYTGKLRDPKTGQLLKENKSKSKTPKKDAKQEPKAEPTPTATPAVAPTATATPAASPTASPAAAPTAKPEEKKEAPKSEDKTTENKPKASKNKKAAKNSIVGNNLAVATAPVAPGLPKKLPKKKSSKDLKADVDKKLNDEKKPEVKAEAPAAAPQPAASPSEKDKKEDAPSETNSAPKSTEHTEKANEVATQDHKPASVDASPNLASAAALLAAPTVNLAANEVKTEPAHSNTAAPVAAVTPAQQATTPTAPAAPATSPAEEPLKLNGLIDFYYAFNGNQPAPVSAPTSAFLAQPSGNNTYHFYDLYHDTPSLALAELSFQKKKGDVTGTIAIDMGHNADVTSPLDESGKNVTQAFITYTPNMYPRLTFNVGKMFTHMGFEVFRAKENWNYSRSLQFAYAIPLWHEGASMGVSLIKDKLNLNLYVYNKSSGAYQTNRSRTTGLQLNYVVKEGLNFIYNYLGGTENLSANRVRNVHEFIGNYVMNPKWNFAFDAVQGNEANANSDGSLANWFSWAVYAKYTMGAFSLTPRYEYFRDGDGYAMSSSNSVLTKQNLESYTLTGSYDLGDGLEARLEFRNDRSTEQVFRDKNSSPSNGQFLTEAAVLYNF